MKNTPWFSTPGKPGDRTLEQQLMGLDRLWSEIDPDNTTVLDVGCAEGLVAIECAARGAACVTGLEIRPEAVAQAHVAKARHPDYYHVSGNNWLQFHVADVNTHDPMARGTPGDNQYDIVLMLAVLHKLKDPSAACHRLVAAARDLVVIRLPPKHAPDIVDDRSGGVIHHIGDVMADCGFDCERAATDGPFGEWVGYYRRAK